MLCLEMLMDVSCCYHFSYRFTASPTITTTITAIIVVVMIQTKSNTEDRYYPTNMLQRP